MSSTGNENRELRTGWKRHTGVLEGTPSSEAALKDAHGKRMRDRLPALRDFSRIRFAGREGHVKEGRRFAGQPYTGPAFHCVGPHRGLLFTRAPAFVSPLRHPGAGVVNRDSVLATLLPHCARLSYH